MRASPRPVLLLALLAPIAACTGGGFALPTADLAVPTADLAVPTDGGVPNPDGPPAVGTIRIYLKGDLTTPPPADGLASQTPTDYRIALSRYHILRAADDPAPVLCFDHGRTPTVADLTTDNLVGTSPPAPHPPPLYTYGRTKVDWARFSVAGTYHYQGQKLPGTFTFFRAYSDTTYNGKPYKAGEGTITFTGVVTVEYPIVYPTLQDLPGVRFEVINGEFLMTFAYTHPLPIDQKNTDAHWARFNWQILQSFRWTDAPLTDYQPNVWDVALIDTEAVQMYGTSGYYVTSSVD